MFNLCIVWSGDCKPTLYPILVHYMGLCEDDPSCDKTTMRLCLQVVPRHVGDIAASWVLQKTSHHQITYVGNVAPATPTPPTTAHRRPVFIGSSLSRLHVSLSYSRDMLIFGRSIMEKHPRESPIATLIFVRLRELLTSAWPSLAFLGPNDIVFLFI